MSTTTPPKCEHGNEYYCGRCGVPAGTKFPIRNATTCGICRGPADRHPHMFVCQANPNHVGDLNVGLFADLTYTPSQATKL